MELTLWGSTLAIRCIQTTALCEAVFRKVREVVPQFQPTEVIADFEQAPLQLTVQSSVQFQDVGSTVRKRLLGAYSCENLVWWVN